MDYGIKNCLQQISVYPNPTDNSISIKSNMAITSIEDFDVSGKLLQT